MGSSSPFFNSWSIMLKKRCFLAGPAGVWTEVFNRLHVKLYSQPSVICETGKYVNMIPLFQLFIYVTSTLCFEFHFKWHTTRKQGLFALSCDFLEIICWTGLLWLFWCCSQSHGASTWFSKWRKDREFHFLEWDIQRGKVKGAVFITVLFPAFFFKGKEGKPLLDSHMSNQ